MNKWSFMYIGSPDDPIGVLISPKLKEAMWKNSELSHIDFKKWERDIIYLKG